MRRPFLLIRGLLGSCWRNRILILSLIRRDVASRYQGSIMGLVWSFLLPMAMLGVYTFVFSVVFQARWGGSDGSRTEFAVVLFVGLMVFTLFAECVGRAPTLVSSNLSYVKKIVFPLEVLPLVAIGASMFHTLINLMVWLVFFVLVFGVLHPTMLLFPLVLLPLVLVILGVSWFLASLGVFVRDVAHVVAVVVPSLMFLSPIFYPVSALPDNIQGLLMLNPLTPVIEWSRDVLIWGRVPELGAYVIYLVVATVVALSGYAWFQKTRRGFADVL